MNVYACPSPNKYTNFSECFFCKMLFSYLKIFNSKIQKILKFGWAGCPIWGPNLGGCTVFIYIYIYIYICIYV